MAGSWIGFADDLFIKDVLPDHTADSAKDVILNNAESSDNTLAEDRYKKNLRKLEQRRLTSLVPFGQILGGARHFGADTLSTVATTRKSSADYRRWRRTDRHCEAGIARFLVRTLAMDC